MKRIRLIVAYDGTHYCGWQIQPNGITIEEVINRALSKLLGNPCASSAQAGRTQAYTLWEMWPYLIRIRASRRSVFPMP